MLKEDRLHLILSTVDKNQMVEVSELAQTLQVAEMTIRRDLKELEERKLVTRVFGGARKVSAATYTELSHTQKQSINVEKKREIAQKCAELIVENDIVFIGSGTTNDMIFDYVTVSNVNVITNSITVFNKCKNKPNYDVVLSGGRYRGRTGTFTGYFANKLLSEIKVKKAFVGTNGICDRNVTTADEEEGLGHRIILDNASERYILADSTKFDVQAFFTFYEVENVTAIITDSGISEKLANYYSRMTRIIK